MNERMKQKHPIPDRAGGALCNVLEPYGTCPASCSLAGVLSRGQKTPWLAVWAWLVSGVCSWNILSGSWFSFVLGVSLREKGSLPSPGMT